MSRVGWGVPRPWVWGGRRGRRPRRAAAPARNGGQCGAGRRGRPAAAPSNVVVGVIKAMRPRQWVKNLLVLAAPLAAWGDDQDFDHQQVLIHVGLAFVVFSLAASSIYLVNDALDVEADRAHPTKRYRPCLLYTSPSPRDRTSSRMPSSA